MSLDQNLFTLQVKPSPTESTIVDLTDPAGNVFYRKQRVISGAVYAMRVYDFVSQSLLVTATAPSVTSKVKIIELQNPSVPVELKALGTFSVKWGFQWKGHEFEWKREEECYIIRKPDPPVLVVITSRKEIVNSGRAQQSATIQVLDYNLNRFDIEDRKGLELVFLTSLLAFLDSADARNSTKEEEVIPSSRSSPLQSVAQVSPSSGTDPKDVQRERGSNSGSKQIHGNDGGGTRSTRRGAESGVSMIARMQALRTVVHETTVFEEGEIDDYAGFCWRLLKDEAISFITVRSGHSSQVQKVLEVVEATKRLRYQRGIFFDSG
ncbi:hypothetical protein DFH05DRAFT_1389989 [Lentinula detonsa]|uniref:Uncharacterized protein n=1 Tax=Lentinula detonsa TaxID=2804962 RepID=A0A9W8P8Q8_9AGAR|nr:hypothetical protein DFH05DRAFT_1389989 [Lentinula detonsa]